MDIDYNKMFKEKNKEIFKNSLTLEMERNLDALKNTTDNCVSLEINKLFLFFKNFFQENDIDYKKEELLGILYKEKMIINDLVNNEIEEKKKRLKEEFLESNFDQDIITEEVIDNYYKKLKEESLTISDKIELLISEEVCTNFTLNLIKKYKLEDESQLERINSRVSVLFKNNITSRIKEQIVFRDDSLKNMAKESFNKYLNLNDKTVEE